MNVADDPLIKTKGCPWLIRLGKGIPEIGKNLPEGIICIFFDDFQRGILRINTCNKDK